MPVKTIIRENGKQCMMQMPVKTTLRLYCDNSHLVPSACEIINVLRHSRLVIVDCLLNRHYKKKITWIWMMEMKTTLRLYCDDSHLVSSVWNHQCTATQLWSIVYKTATVKTTWIWRENGLPQQSCFFFFFFFLFFLLFFSMCKLHVRGGY